jgi:glycerol-3-phosphate dehydrogenase
VETRTIQTDVVIFGGGIAGLWLLNRLLKEGRSAYLFENKTLGGEQTIASQGVIHGGLKYALNGVLNDASEAIADMPRRWNESFTGRGELDLRSVQQLSDHQVLWSSGGIASQVTSFFASKTLSSRARQVSRPDYPEVLQDLRYRGSVFQLNEQVVEPSSLVQVMSQRGEGRIFSSGGGTSSRLISRTGRLEALELTEKEICYRFEAQDYVFTAGQGNEELLGQLSGMKVPAMQRRPLHQVCVKRPGLPPFYAVALGVSTKPPLVITTHYDRAGVPVWYLGGDLAETGVAFSEEEQIQRAQKLLRQLLPWLDFGDAQWRTHRVNRAEPAYPGGHRPPGVYCSKSGNAIICWPSKLALSPALSDDVWKLLGKQRLSLESDPIQTAGLTVPPVAEALWDRLF